MKTIRTDLCVIGAGSGGLSVAAGAAQMGVSVVLLESHKMGGDCLNYGCVPSKTLIAAARRAHAFRTSKAFGIEPSEPQIDYAEVQRSVQAVIQSIAPHDSVERFESMGVRVILEKGVFTSPNSMQAGETLIEARKFVIATGSHPIIPKIPGIAHVPYLTNLTLFDLKELPEHLIVLGGGPIGCEMAQSFRRLGSKVTLLQRSNILSKEDHDAADCVREQFQKEGICLHEDAEIYEIQSHRNHIGVRLKSQGQEELLSGSHLLVSSGQKACVDGLGLDAAGIQHNDRGIHVDTGLRTSNKRVYAIGDVIGGPQFTHAANYHAGIVLRNSLFHLRTKTNYQALPRVTYTDPELAHVGYAEWELKQKNIRYKALRTDFADNDRAQTEHCTEGFTKVLVSAKGTVLGATIVGPHAGELITPWTLSIKQKLKIGALADSIIPYPTLNEISKRVAGQYYTPKLASRVTQGIVNLLKRF